jgi:hypothetical protein
MNETYKACVVKTNVFKINAVVIKVFTSPTLLKFEEN